MVEVERKRSVIILDPLSMIGFSGGEPWRDQDEFMRRLIGIAADVGNVILLIAHLTKKPDMSKGLGSGDVQGAAVLSRVASSVLLLERYEKREVEVSAGDDKHETVESNLTVHVAKSRHGEGAGARMAYSFGGNGPHFIEHGVIVRKARKQSDAETNDYWNK
jgi:hypothetical protein